MEEIKNITEEIIKNGLIKAIFSKPKSGEYKKISLTQKKNGFQAEMFTEKQAFHKNLANEELIEFFGKYAVTDFLQINAWTEGFEYIILVSKKGKISCKRKAVSKQVSVNKEHNKEKNYIIAEGTVVPPLVDMGIFTKEGKVVRTMYDKFRQINRFVEIIDDEIKSADYKKLNIIDFGCGKSYLTFILYYYFTEIKKIDVNIIGLDLKKDVIENCNRSAEKYGYKNLYFELGDINGYKTTDSVDMVITLHACDTATDYALYNAVSWNAKMIFSVPCCQHEVNSQIKSEKFSALTKYGIIKERASALITDAIRGNLLEACGYKTQIMEFIDMSHTPKNILIRSVKGHINQQAKKKALSEVENLLNEFNISPTLYNLLKDRLNSNE